MPGTFRKTLMQMAIDFPQGRVTSRKYIDGRWGGEIEARDYSFYISVFLNVLAGLPRMH